MSHTIRVLNFFQVKILCFIMSVVSLAFFDTRISNPPCGLSPQVDWSIKKALQTRISPGLIGGEIRYLGIINTLGTP